MFSFVKFVTNLVKFLMLIILGTFEEFNNFEFNSSFILSVCAINNTSIF